MSALVLYDYWRSTASYRVRIALHLKGLAFRQVPVHLVQDGGQQHSDAHRARNPAAAVPVLEDGPVRVRQSLAICEYLEETRPEPALLPADPAARAHVRELALLVACDIHPLNNLRVMQELGRRHGVEGEARAEWMHHWMAQGFDAFEAMLEGGGDFCHGGAPTLADACLVPQLYNAHRFGLDLAQWPRLRRIEAACMALAAFQAARPENQPDAG